MPIQLLKSLHGVRIDRTSSSTSPTCQRSPISASLTSMPERGEVLAELPVGDLVPELGRPRVEVLAGEGVDRLVDPAVVPACRTPGRRRDRACARRPGRGRRASRSTCGRSPPTPPSRGVPTLTEMREAMPGFSRDRWVAHQLNVLVDRTREDFAWATHASRAAHHHQHQLRGDLHVRSGLIDVLPWLRSIRPALTLVDPVAVVLAALLIDRSASPAALGGAALAAVLVCRGADLHRSRLVLSVVEELPRLALAAGLAALTLGALTSGTEVLTIALVGADSPGPDGAAPRRRLHRRPPAPPQRPQRPPGDHRRRRRGRPAADRPPSCTATSSACDPSASSTPPPTSPRATCRCPCSATPTRSSRRWRTSASTTSSSPSPSRPTTG